MAAGAAAGVHTKLHCDRLSQATQNQTVQDATPPITISPKSPHSFSRGLRSLTINPLLILAASMGRLLLPVVLAVWCWAACALALQPQQSQSCVVDAGCMYQRPPAQPQLHLDHPRLARPASAGPHTPEQASYPLAVSNEADMDGNGGC